MTDKNSLLAKTIGQILSPQPVFGYCHDQVQRKSHLGFYMHMICKKTRLWPALQFLLGSTIRGTHYFCHFEPLTNSSVRDKRTSEDSSLTCIHYFSYDDLIITGNDYIACKYDGRWLLGLFSRMLM